MKFTKDFPKKDGYYYYCDIEYPIPIVGFLYTLNHEHRIQRLGCSDYTFYDNTARVHYRFGDAVPMPECKDMKIEK